MSSKWKPSRPTARDWAWLGRELDELHKSFSDAWWPLPQDYKLNTDYLAAIRRKATDQLFAEDGAQIHRVPDRMFIGDTTRYTGNRLGTNGYGDSWIIEHAATWIAKNSVFASSSEGDNGRIGVLGASRTSPGSSSSVNCGVAGLSLNEGSNSFGRAFYAEAMHKATGTASTVGLEVQVGNWSASVPVANAYSMGSSLVNGLYVGVESGTGYTIGDADSAIVAASNPAGAALDIAGGSLSASYQKWTTGIVFRNGALVRDGVTNIGVAMSMAQEHQINWMVNSSSVGALMRSEVSDATQPVGLVFKNRAIDFVGASERVVTTFIDDTSGAGAVNWSVVKNSRTGIPVAFGADGSDTDVSTDVYAKGQGVVRLMTHAGTGEGLRVLAPVNAATDYLTITGSAGLGVATLGAGGASANIDVALTPKGTGLVRFSTHTATADTAISGYITIKDSGGTTRKLAVIT